MKCWYCNNELIWQNDIRFEDRGLEGKGTIIVFVCDNSEGRTTVEIYKED